MKLIGDLNLKATELQHSMGISEPKTLINHLAERFSALTFHGIPHERHSHMQHMPGGWLCNPSQESKYKFYRNNFESVPTYKIIIFGNLLLVTNYS